jgi:hypothetical protein
LTVGYKCKAQLEWEAQEAADRAWMREQEARTDGPWLCGLRGVTPDLTDIWATCLTEQDAERYMMMRHDRNGGVMPHRLGVQDVGWWPRDGK